MELGFYAYLVFIGGVVALFPIVFAAIVSVYPGKRPKRKILFILLSAILALGIAGIVEIFLLPIELAEIYIAPQLEVDGYSILSNAISSSTEYIVWIPAIIGIIAGVFVPIYLRRKIWGRFLNILEDNE